MKIAVVAPSTIPARRANTIQVMKMAQALARLGHQVRLAAPHDSGQEKSTPLPQSDWEGLAHTYGLSCEPFPVDWLPAAPRLRRYDYGWRAVRWAQDWRAEILYTRLPQAAAQASLRGLPTLLEIHDFPQGRVGPLLLRAFLRGRGACRLVVITRSLLTDLERSFRVSDKPLFTLVAPDGVDLERYHNLPAPEEARLGLPALAGRGFTAGYTGHLYPGRGVELLLDLAGRLPEMTFLLVGGEPEDIRRARAKASEEGLANLLLPGFVPNAELPSWQAACDVLLMPYERRVSASSGGDIARYLSPMKLFEYLACGRPVLSSNLPPLREVLTAENAVLLPPGDAEAWASALHELCQDPVRRAGLAVAALREAKHYSWEARAEHILEGISLHA